MMGIKLDEENERRLPLTREIILPNPNVQDTLES